MVIDYIDSEKPVATARPDATVAELVDTMNEYNVGSIVVIENEKPTGIVTDRDVAMACGSGVDSQTSVAADIMRSPVTTVEAGSSLLQVLQKMGSAGVRRLPVVEKGRLVDIVTLDDIVRLSAEILGELKSVIERESPQKISDFLEETPMA